MPPQHCPNCQHENPPGEQFCARCGVPLNLKPCPACGKVDSISATVCTGCGAAFPPLEVGTVAAAARRNVSAGSVLKGPPPIVRPPSRPIGALPLIIVAVAAGGIPLLWMYRNNMPLPKAWQPQAQSAPALHPAVAPAAPAAAAASVPATPSAEPAVAQAPAAPVKPEPAPEPEAARAERASPPAPDAPAPAPAAASKPKPAAKPAPRQQNTCTEALAAVGLCDPKAVRK